MLQWLAPEDSGLAGPVTGYNIWRYSNGVWSEIVVATGSTAAIYTDNARLSDGWHWYALRAINAAGAGEWSESAGVTTAANVPSAPSALYAVEAGSNVQLNWTAPLSDGGSPITGYRVWRSDGIAWSPLARGHRLGRDGLYRQHDKLAGRRRLLLPRAGPDHERPGRFQRGRLGPDRATAGW